jgi:hypothetical protein
MKVRARAEVGELPRYSASIGSHNYVTCWSTYFWYDQSSSRFSHIGVINYFNV